MNITVNNRVTVSRHATDSVQRDPVDQTEEVEFPTRATTKAVDPEGEAAATEEEEEEITVGSPLNPNHPTLTTTTTDPKGRKNHHQDRLEVFQAKDPTAIRETVIATTR